MSFTYALSESVYLTPIFLTSFTLKTSGACPRLDVGARAVNEGEEGGERKKVVWKRGLEAAQETGK